MKNGKPVFFLKFAFFLNIFMVNSKLFIIFEGVFENKDIIFLILLTR